MRRSELTEERRTSFDRAAEAYDAIRPSYATDAIDAVLAATGARRLVEVGAGTGKATVLFASRAQAITALEPGANLASVLRRNVAAFPHVTIVETTFEAWPGEPADLVYAAQAWHWVDPAQGYRKAERTAPALAIIRNEKAPLPEALRAAFDAAYRQYMPSNDDDRIDDQVAEVAREQTAEIAASGLYRPAEVSTFPWTQHYTTDEYLALLSTYSDHATLDVAARIPLYEAIATAIESHGGSVEVPYVTMVFLAFR